MWCSKVERWLEVEEAQPHQSLLLVKFKGIDDRTSAEALFQGELRMHLADLEPLPEGEYYYVQLIGLDVYSEGKLLGPLVDILETGANDCLLYTSLLTHFSTTKSKELESFF